MHIRALVFAILALVTPHEVMQDARIAGPRTPLQASFFGMHFHDFIRGEAWPTVEFAEWRLWDTSTTWTDLEPQRDQWNFTRLDSLMQQAEQHHVRVLLTLGQTPAWASSHPEDVSYHGHGAAHAPLHLDDWSHYIEVLATRYKGRIEAYEVWNEPNLPTYYRDSPESMAALTKEAATVLRRVDPAARLISPSPTATDGIPWLKRYLHAGGGQSEDVIGYHLYVMPNAPEAMLPLIEQLHATIAEAGLSAKPVWDTETTWGGVRDGLDLAHQRGYLARALALAAVTGIDRVYWYAWDNHSWANIQLVSTDNRSSLTPSVAYTVTRSQLLGAVIENCAQTGKVWTCKLQRPDGLHYLAWTTGPEAHWQPPVTTGCPWTKQDLDGEVSSVSSAIQLSEEIVFLQQPSSCPSHTAGR